MVLRRLADWVLKQIIQDVPESTGLCEFDCRKVECSQSEWETCEWRLNRARGEFMPAPVAVKNVRSEPCDEVDKRRSLVSLTIQ